MGPRDFFPLAREAAAAAAERRRFLLEDDMAVTV
jgi:hypothetical protein